MGALDIAIIGPAFPAMQKSFGVGNRALARIFSIYVLFKLVGTHLMAKLSDLPSFALANKISLLVQSTLTGFRCFCLSNLILRAIRLSFPYFVNQEYGTGKKSPRGEGSIAKQRSYSLITWLAGFSSKYRSRSMLVNHSK